jgi:hypothetical protein
MRLIDADAAIKYLQEFRCKDCDRRKGMKNGKIRFCYEMGDAPCRACDIGDTIDYFLEEDILPTIDAVQVVRCKDCKHRPKEPNFKTYENGFDIEFPDSKCPCKCSGDEYYSWYPEDDWFCADGRRRDVE